MMERKYLERARKTLESLELTDDQIIVIVDVMVDVMNNALEEMQQEVMRRLKEAKSSD